MIGHELSILVDCDRAVNFLARGFPVFQISALPGSGITFRVVPAQAARLGDTP